MSATQCEFSALLPFSFFYPEAVDENGDPLDGFNLYNTRAYADRAECGVFWDNWTHIANCTDLNDIQINSPVSSNLVIKRVSDGATVDTISPTNPSGNIREYSIDWSAVTCDECYYLEISGGSVNSSQLITGNDSTFDGTIGSATGPQTYTHETTPSRVRTGAGSLEVTFNVSDLEAVNLKSSVSFEAGKNYLVECWTYQESVLPALSSGEFGFIFPSSTGKINVINETRIDTSGTKDAWVKLSIEFQAIETFTSDIEIVTNGTWEYPSGASMWIDDFTATESNKVELIRSEPIRIKTAWACSKIIQYYNDENIDLLDFSTGIKLKSRLPVRKIDTRSSVQRSVFEFSDGSRETLRSTVSVIDVFEFDFAPPEIVVNYASFLSCDTVKIDGIDYVSNKDADVDSSPKYSLAGANFELIRKTSTLLNSTC